MKLSELNSLTDYINTDIAPDIADITFDFITDDTRQVKVGALFVCIKGANFDGHDAAQEMLGKGAACVITERDLGLTQQVIVPDTRQILAELFSEYYGSPTEDIKLIAVTGTNGKTTTVNFIRYLIELTSEKCAVIGTAGNYDGEKETKAELTTPTPDKMYALFRQIADNGVRYCAFEASSQALTQKRFANETFEVGIFTNLTRDHLDYHKTMEEYYKAKRVLFDKCKCAVVCIDDEYGKRLTRELQGKIPIYTFSADVKTADYYADEINGDAFWITSPNDRIQVNTDLLGLFNIRNALGAYAAAHIVRGMSYRGMTIRFPSVSGRCETIYSGKYRVIRDYAHTPDGIEKILSALLPLAKNRLIVLFGATGERDKGKRPEMGEIAARYADYLVITTDNPANEPPEDTIHQVEYGVIPSGKPYDTFVDRGEAIRRVVDIANTGDIIALLGKGHETYQTIGNEKTHFDEKEIVLDILKHKNNL